MVPLQGPATDSRDDEDEPPVTPDEILDAVNGSSSRSDAGKTMLDHLATDHGTQILPSASKAWLLGAAMTVGSVADFRGIWTFGPKPRR